MHPRQRSMWVTSSSVTSAPASASPISTIRPRGESASFAHSTYVGQVCRQKPQWTQSSTMARSDAANEHPRIAYLRRIEPLLDPAHQLERGLVARRTPRVNGVAKLVRRVEEHRH